jgi:small subunit ribosomal protein S6
MPRPYETMLIVRPDAGDEALAQLIDTQKAVLSENGATQVETSIRGKRRMAYDIKRCKEGVYVQLNYDSEPVAKEAMEKGLRLNESILRFETFRLDEQS